MSYNIQTPVSHLFVFLLTIALDIQTPKSIGNKFQANASLRGNYT